MALPARPQVTVNSLLRIKAGEIHTFLVDIDSRRLRVLVRLRHRAFKAVGPERRVMAERRHRLAPLIITRKALESGVDQTSSGKGNAGRPVGVGCHLDEYRVLVWGEAARTAAVLHQFADRLVAHRLDRGVYDDDQVAVSGNLLAVFRLGPDGHRHHGSS